MRPNQANILNALTLILIGIWGAWASTSWTAKIPIAFGISLLCLQPWLLQSKKWSLILSSVLSLAFALSLIMPALRMYDELNYVGVFRILLMIIIGLWAAYILVKSIPRASNPVSQNK